jgi:hypothetical protein
MIYLLVFKMRDESLRCEVQIVDSHALVIVTARYSHKTQAESSPITKVSEPPRESPTPFSHDT